jgi:hypothetical protein
MANIQVKGLVPGKSYDVQIRAKDGASYSDWSNKFTFTALADTTAPSTPSAASILVSNNSADYLNTLTARVKINGYTSASQVIETDTAYFEVYAASVNSSTSANKIGDVRYARVDGVNSEATLTVPVSGTASIVTPANVLTSLYFFIRAVDRSGNKSDFSAGALPQTTTYFANAYISDLSADKIVTGTLQANQQISVGNTTPIVIKANASAPLGQLYSGTGASANANTPFYLDTAGNFTLSDSVKFTSGGASIAGWTVTASSLYSGTGASYVALANQGLYSFWAGGATAATAQFSITNTGFLVANAASIAGFINAQSGFISGNLIVSGSLSGGLISGASITGASVTTASLYGNLITAGSISGTNLSGVTGNIGGYSISSTQLAASYPNATPELYTRLFNDTYWGSTIYAGTPSAAYINESVIYPSASLTTDPNYIYSYTRSIIYPATTSTNSYKQIMYKVGGTYLNAVGSNERSVQLWPYIPDSAINEAGGTTTYSSIIRRNTGLSIDSGSFSGYFLVSGSADAIKLGTLTNGQLYVNEVPMSTVQGGTATITASYAAGISSASTAVSFPTTFKSVPVVTVSLTNAPGGSGGLVPRALNTTASGFTLYYYNAGGVSSGAITVTSAWIAAT